MLGTPAQTHQRRVQPRHVHIESRRDVERQELREQQAADHGDGIFRAQAGALPGQREVDHHDAVFLHQPHQQDDADEAEDVEFLRETRAVEMNLQAYPVRQLRLDLRQQRLHGPWSIH